MSFDETAHVKVIEDHGTQERRVPMREFAEVLSPLLPAVPGSYTDADADLRVVAGIAVHVAAGDPHPGYLTTAEGNAAYAVISHDHDLVYAPIAHDHDLVYAPIVHDHDADYEPLGAVASAISTHEGAVNPHPTYLTQAEGDALYAAVTVTQYTDGMADARVAAGIATHNAAGDPHTGYVLESALDELIDDRVAALLTEGAGVSLTYTDGSGTLEIAVALSAPTMGVATVDFGAFPGKQQANVTVSGQTGLISSSKIQAWIAPIATADHGIDDHICESQFLKATPYFSVNGTFIIQVETINPPQTRPLISRQGERYRVWDDFSIGWSWAN